MNIGFKKALSDNSDFFGGAVLDDRDIGSVTLRDASGSVFKLGVSDDPELMMSGLYEPDSRYDWI